MSLPEQQATAMAKIMVEARQKDEDVGELIAAALHEAGKKLGGMGRLVQGRPGSWEADIVLRMAEEGGSGNPDLIEHLAQLFLIMGQPGVDGGDLLSFAMGEAVNELGSLKKFAELSRWYYDLTNIGKQYADDQSRDD
jgi:hypothetical protein